MTSPILIPVQVDALVIDAQVIQTSQTSAAVACSRTGSDVHKATEFRDLGPELFLGDPKAPIPLGEADYGVHVRWALPQFLRHAYSGELKDFLVLPDVWLVVRFHRTAPDAAVDLKAWVVRPGAAYSGGDTRAANQLIVDGSTRTSGRVGTEEVFDDAYPRTQPTLADVTAVAGPTTGSPTYAALVADGLGGLALHDDLSDVLPYTPGAKAGDSTTGLSLSYAVLGWATGTDPLQAVQPLLKNAHDFVDDPTWTLTPEVLADALQLSFAGGAPSDLLERRSLLHGMVAGVDFWDASKYRGGMLGTPGCILANGGSGNAAPALQPAIGPHAQGALTALIVDAAKASSEDGEATDPTLWELLDSILEGRSISLSDAWNSESALSVQHGSWFTTAPTGLTWELGPTGAAPPPGTKTPPIDDVLLRNLDALNAAQATLDLACRDIAALHPQLYATWWAGAAAGAGPLSRYAVSVEAMLAELGSGSKRLFGEATAAKETRDTALAALTGVPSDLTLQARPAPPAQRRKDPTVAVAGVQSAGALDVPAEDVPCRVADPAWKQVAVTSPQGPIPNASGVADPSALIARVNAKLTDAAAEIRTSAAALLAEMVLLEQGVATLAGDAPSAPTEGVFEAWVKKVWSATDPSAESPTYRIALDGDDGGTWAARGWGRQPWLPLLLDWEIAWSETPVGDDHDFRDHWELDDAAYTLSDAEVSLSDPVVLQGRCFSNPLPATWLEQCDQRLARVASQTDTGTWAKSVEAAAQAWQTALSGLEADSVYVHTLSGFSDALMDRTRLRAAPDPDADCPWSPATGNLTDAKVAPGLAAQVASIVDAKTDTGLSLPDRPVFGDGVFNETPAPARGGVLQLTKLTLLDAYGQRFDLLDDSLTQESRRLRVHPSMVVPTPGTSKTPDRTPAAFAPAVLQPSRLDLSLAPAWGRDPKTGAPVDPKLTPPRGMGPYEQAAGSPICGVVVYNHVDQSFVLCDADGALLGELSLGQTPGGTFAPSWESLSTLPDATNPYGIAEPTLAAFVAAVCPASPTPAAQPLLKSLLDLIDTALPVISPQAKGAGDVSTLLAGRPLVLVNLDVALELYGQAWQAPDTKWSRRANRGTTGSDDLDALSLPLALGTADNSEDGLVGFFTWNGQTPDFSKITTHHAYADTKDPNVQVEATTNGLLDAAGRRLSLLLDPQCSVSVGSGVVPARSVRVLQSHVDRALSNLELAVRSDPMLERTASSTDTAPAHLVPVPATGGSWSYRGQDGALVPTSPDPSAPSLTGGVPMLLGGHLVRLPPEDPS